jgi:hypothetical protein
MSDCFEMRHEATELTDELRMLDVKLKALKRDYEQYFLGSRPREPANTRREMQKAMIRLANGVIKNTGERFKFNTLNSQFVTYKRHWDDTLRKMENGTYKRHIFKANLHERERELKDQPAPAEDSAPEAKRVSKTDVADEIFKHYMEAAKSCGQNTAGLTPAKLQKVMDKQAGAIKIKLGVKQVKFRVEVVDGKVKLKARALKTS